MRRPVGSVRTESVQFDGLRRRGAGVPGQV